MPFTLDIIPHVPSLDMYGSPKPNTNYSLSGEIVLTLTSSAQNLNSSTIYLTSLQILFEGRMELCSTNCGYVPNRLCLVEKELVSGSKPLILTNSGIKRLRAMGKLPKEYKDPAGTMRWSMTFDIAVPGFLPPTANMGDGSGTAYTLHAKAKFSDDFTVAASAMAARGDPISPSSSILASLNPFSRSRLREASAPVMNIKVNRYRSPKSLNPFSVTGPESEPELVPPQIAHPTPSLFPVTLESVETRVSIPAGTAHDMDQKRIPINVLSHVEIVAGVPEYISMSEEKIPLSLRVRSMNDPKVNKGLVLEAFDVEVEQVERFRSYPCERYSTTYPVPSRAEQPPHKPLLATSGSENFYPIIHHEPVQWSRMVPMIPSKRVNFRPSPATGGLEVDGEWAKMDLSVSVVRKSDIEEVEDIDDESDEELFNFNNTNPSNKKKEMEERRSRNTRRRLLNPDMDTPLSKTRHEMKIALRLSWLDEESAREVDEQIAESAPPRPLGPIEEGDRKRRIRAAHPERKTETLLISLPVKLVQVCDQVELMYKSKLMGVGALGLVNAMQRTEAQTAPRQNGLTGGAWAESLSAAVTAAASRMLQQPSLHNRSSTDSLNSQSSSATSSASSSHTRAPSTSSSSSRATSPPMTPPSQSLSVSPPTFQSIWGAFPFALPPYSELYHTNGDRKETPEDSWLPPYVPKEEVTVSSQPPVEGETTNALGVALNRPTPAIAA